MAKRKRYFKLFSKFSVGELPRILDIEGFKFYNAVMTFH